VLSHLDAHGLSAAIPFVRPPRRLRSRARARADDALYLDAEAVARRLGLPSAAKVYDLARRGAIGCSRFGKYVRFSEADVQRYESESKRRPRSEYLQGVDLGALPPPPVPGQTPTRRKVLRSRRKPFKPQF
jgi:excisionase family DNA binding protein